MSPRKKKETIRKLRITLRKSVIGYSERQKGTVKALGLHRMGQTVEKNDSPVLRGMVAKVSHLVDVQEVEG
jgi:large subunit ribosomal protein L30